MQSKYTSLEELGDNILEPQDVLTFLGSTHYLVSNNALLNEGNGSPNDEIFTILGVDKNKFCEESYGYHPMPPHQLVWGQFPTTKLKDFDALTRVAKKLFELCKEKQKTAL